MLIQVNCKTVAHDILLQGRIYSKPGPVQKKIWSPRAPNTIIGLLLPPTVVVSWRLQCVCQSTVPQHRQSTLDTDASATQNFLSYLLLQWLSRNFCVLARCRNFFWSLCGGPIFVGPLFGRTCWTCLNPPLYFCQCCCRCVVSCHRKWCSWSPGTLRRC